ncbi:uncharacterized protein BDR25DRAFT_97031 [Lindgomyces ingoldianus]|uniref:Uncharacterized protein n=1 Tax=Lindgomyces ingoldianus TaxID=673940 RepID=A0ACB6QE56_9PLEO|nr:uncharacterized protein BDR25DRAFT_97031 [Lindgomyces ingoldianus]KAF2464407.1 hypothetical protein BDR25DRAFT_97031 [Lindgomyces ingoldianus]
MANAIAAPYRPPSPSASPPSSPTSSPTANLKQSAGTQPATAFADKCALSDHYLAEWEVRYNRRSIPLMPSWGFERLVASVVEQMAAVGGIEGVEAEVARRMQHETDRLEDEMDGSKLDLFLTPPSALPSELPPLLSNIRETTVQGHAQFVITALSLLRRCFSDRGPATPPKKPTRPKAAARQANAAPRTTRKRRSDSPPTIPTLRRSSRVEKKKKLSKSSP